MVGIKTDTYTVIAHEAEEGGWWGEVLELPGCVSQGESIEEFRANIREAIGAVLESPDEEGPQFIVQVTPPPPEKDAIIYFNNEPQTWTAAH